MNLPRHPELLDKLACAYALGTLRGGARRRFETLAREHSPVRAAALIWQSRVASMNELQAPDDPAPAVWTRIQNLVLAGHDQAARGGSRVGVNQAPPRGWLNTLALWRWVSAAGAMATVVAVISAMSLRGESAAQIGELQAKLSAAPQIEYVAVLNDGQSAASMLVTFDPKNRRLTLQRIGAYQEAADKSLQLWALPRAGAPRSLGVLSAAKLLDLAAALADVREVPALAVSLEPKGGVPSDGGPTGPVLFKGALIQKTL